MQVINNLINLFSTGDYVQPVLGLYGRQFPPQDRLINIEVTLKDHEKKSIKHPGHFKLHHSCIARWLLYIPDVLAAQKIGDFQKFTYDRVGAIMFDPQNVPTYFSHVH
jgi:hypothetical protein